MTHLHVPHQIAFALIVETALLLTLVTIALVGSRWLWGQLIMTNSATVQNSSGFDSRQVLRRLPQLIQQASPQLTQVFQTLIPLQTADPSSTSKTGETVQGPLVAGLPPERQTELKRLVFAAFDVQKRRLKDIEAFVQLLEATQQVLVEHWGSLPAEVKVQLAAVCQVMLDVISSASTGNSPIQAAQLPPERLQERLARLLRYLASAWPLFKHPRRTAQYLQQLLVVLPQFARTVQRLNDRDIRLAQFQQKLTQDNWNREEQIERNQAAIAWIQEQRRQDEAMNEAEANQAKADFEAFKQIMDKARPPGNKLYTHE